MKRIFFLGMSICLLILANASAEKIDFETDKGWIVTGSGQGKFEIGVPKVFSTSGGECKTTCLGTGPSGDHSEVGVNAACTNLDGHIAPSETLATNSLTSPVYNFSQKTNVTLELWRFMEIEGNNYDFCYYQYKNSPTGQWVNLETYGAAQIDDNNWVKYSRDLSSIAGGKSYFQLRFYCTTDDWTEGSGLCIDDITITGAESCIPNCQGYTCGMDPVCGTLSCDNPGCTGGDKCENGSCIPCVPNTCASLGYQCGVHGDGCGGVTPDCGTCVGGDICQNGVCRPSSKGIILVQLDDTSPEQLDTANLAVEKFHNEGIALTPELWPRGLSNSNLLNIALLWDSWPEVEIAQGVYSGDSCDSSLVADIRKGKLEYAAAGITQPTSYLPHMCYPSSSALDGLRDEGILIVIDYTSPDVVRNGDPSDPSQQPLTIDGGRDIASNGVDSYSTVLASVQSQVARKGYADLAFHVWIIDESTLQKIITIMKQLREEGYTFMTATEYYRFLWGGGSSCGNAKLEAGEECDDGNLIDNDGCSSKCLIEIPANLDIVKICDWKGCAAGAASVSVDDSYASCRDKLNAHGWKGTYYLLGTKKFSAQNWNLWKSIYNEGHEIGSHTQTHPCKEVSDSTLRSEISSNINDILKNLNMPKKELTSFAWPCGFNTQREKNIAKEYFISARGYHINELEDKNPLDFMEIKSLNTPNYHNPPYTPPDYFDMADLAESSGKWVNFVFHNECEDDGAIDYLASKKLWVAPVGKVAKYIIERQSTNIINFQNTSSTIKFDLVDSLNHTLFNQELTIKVFMREKTAKILEINGINKTFNSFTEDGKKYIKFNILPTSNDKIEIMLETKIICGNGTLESGEECDDGNIMNGDGCNKDCKIETELYLAPYVGDIDGNIDSDWFFFFDQLRRWHDEKNIKVGFSFYPRTIQNNTQFNKIIADMYLSDNIELLYKGEGKDGKELHNMSYGEVKTLMESDLNYFVSKMQKILGINDIKLPVSYNQLYGKFTNTIRDVIHELGFKIYFEQYVSEYGYIEPLPDLDVMQYSVSFTTSGKAGPNEVFKQPEDIFREILTFKHDHTLYINSTKVVSLLTHQQDFLISENSSILNQQKWDIYTKVLLMAKNDTRIHLLKPKEIYDLRHPYKFICGNGILETGEECDTIYSCKSSNCSKTYFDYCNGSRLVEYDNDKRLDNTTVTNYCENECNNCICTKCSADCPVPNTNMYCVKDVCGAQCVQDADCGSNYKCDLNKCSCVLINEPYCGDGIKNGNEECDDGNLVGGDGCSGDCRIEKSSICQYASSASATSENSGSLAKYAVGKPNAPKAGCNGWTQWSGYGYTWSPQNWNIKANLTLFYDKAVYVTNFTIYGDYDMCWSRMWLRNNATAQQNLVFSGYDENCISTHKLNGDFLANIIILETCGLSWSSTDAVELCGDIR